MQFLVNGLIATKLVEFIGRQVFWGLQLIVQKSYLTDHILFRLNKCITDLKLFYCECFIIELS